MKLKQHFLEFIGCHGGTVNRILHMIGFILIFVGIIIKNVYIVLVGAVVQEKGHFYQYSKTKEKKDSPLQCLKPQLIFAYPLLILIIIYVLS